MAMHGALRGLRCNVLIITYLSITLLLDDSMTRDDSATLFAMSKVIFEPFSDAVSLQYFVLIYIVMGYDTICQVSILKDQSFINFREDLKYLFFNPMPSSLTT
jgi:hypothetical protein